MLGLLVKKPDKLYIRLKAEDLLDVDGFFRPGLNHSMDGLFLTDVTETRLVPAECNKDKEEDAKAPPDVGYYVYRSKIYKSTRIELQFDFRNE